MWRVLLAFGLLAGLAACQTPEDSGDLDQAWHDCQLEGEGRSDQAQLVHDACTRLIEQSDDSYRVASAYNNRSLVLFYWQRNDDAIADLNKAIVLNPGHSKYHHNRGRVYSRQGENEKAFADFQEAIRLDPENKWARNNYAWHLAEVGAYAAAWPHAEQAVALDPNSYLFTDTLAHVLMGLGHVVYAESAFDHAMALGGAEMIRGYQEALVDKGYVPGRQDGVLDETTRSALSACIRDNCRLLLD